ncbi:MAG: saccharopine dehydrogenase C-terminal domain-containing protein [Minisyncoccia bacterium]|jgi:saccharopine dehydrogenase (NAD+, L-lysine-forming)
MKYDFAVLGADGIQGRIVVRDLLEQGYHVFAADLYKTKLAALLERYDRRRYTFARVDLRNIDAAKKVIRRSGADVVINCADMYWNLNVYKACLATRRHCVDLGSWIELTRQQLGLDRRFKEIGRTAITGCGSVPGIGNVMLRYAAKKFDTVESVDVGFAWDSNQKKFVEPFSMKSILEELTYNPKFIKNGRWTERRPLEVVRERNYRLVGRQKAFLIQHPEIYTFYRNYKAKGLKNVRFFGGFPEHSLEKIRALIDLNFHRDKPVKLEGIRVAPFDMLAPVLKTLPFPDGYTEKENLFVEITGRKNGKRKKILMECLVPVVKGWENAGCNIDTGFPAVIMAKMIKEGVIKEPGSFSPEAVVPEEPFFRALAKKKLEVYENGKRIN